MLIRLTVKPNSKSDQFSVEENGSIRVKIKAPALDGKANHYLLDYLSKVFSVSKAYIQLVKGENNPHKTVQINIPEVHIRKVLEGYLTQK